MKARLEELIREHRDAIISVLAVAGTYGVMFAAGITCPIKAVTGISCPGCGMTRAWLSLLRLDIGAAFYYHPMVLLPPVWLAAYAFRERHPSVYKAVTAAAIAAMLAVYVLRMMDPGNRIVVCEPAEGFFFRGIQTIKEMFF